MAGIHVSLASKVDKSKRKTLETALRADIEGLALTAAQIFTHGPRTQAAGKLNRAAVRKIVQDAGVDLFVHATYVSVGVWRKGAGVEHLTDMLGACREVGARGLVLHLPKQKPDVITTRLGAIADDIKSDSDVPIILEMPASTPGDNTYETAAKLRHLCTGIPRGLNWGLCIDTAHQYSCGVNFGVPGVWTKWVHELGKWQKKIHLIHLNGAREENFGRGRDVHEIVGGVRDAVFGGAFPITSDGNAGAAVAPHAEHAAALTEVVTWAKTHAVTLILEINTDDAPAARRALNGIKLMLEL